MRATASASSPSLRAAMTTDAPRSAAISAVVRPMPLDAPVMTITWSFRLFLFSFMAEPRCKNKTQQGGIKN